MATKKAKAPAVDQVALLKAAGLTDEQIKALVPATPAPAPVAPTPVPEPPKAVVSGSGNPGVVPALASVGIGAGKAMLGAGKFAALGATPVTKSKSKTPEVQIPALASVIAEFLKQTAAQKAAERLADEAKASVAAKAEPERVALSRKLGELQESLYVNGAVTYVQPHGYKNIALEKGQELAILFGDDNFNAFFEVRNEVKVSDEESFSAILDDVVAICKAKGLDPAKLFSVRQVLSPTRALTTARVMKEDIAALFAKASSEGLITSKAPTVKEK